MKGVITEFPNGIFKLQMHCVTNKQKGLNSISLFNIQFLMLQKTKKILTFFGQKTWTRSRWRALGNSKKQQINRNLHLVFEDQGNNVFI